MSPKEEAMQEILRALANPLYMMSKPSRERVFKLADEFDLTVKEVLEYRQKQNERK